MHGAAEHLATPPEPANPPRTSPPAQGNSNGDTCSKNRISGVFFPCGPACRHAYLGGLGVLKSSWMLGAPLWKGLPS